LHPTGSLKELPPFFHVRQTIDSVGLLSCGQGWSCFPCLPFPPPHSPYQSVI